MKILHVVPTYLPAHRYGGPIQSVHGLCMSLAALGHEVHIFTTNVDGPKDLDVPVGQPVNMDGVIIWYFSSKYFRRFYYSPAMKEALEKNISNFNLVHLHSIFLWPTWVAARTARKAKVPYVVAPRGMLVKGLIRKKSYLAKTLWIQLAEKYNLENANRIHMTSELEAKEVKRFGFKLPPCFVVPNGIDVHDITEQDRINKSSPLVASLLEKSHLLLSLGRINWKKGLDRLIPAMAHVPNAYLAVVGNDEENYLPFLRKLAFMHGVSERVIFSGPLYGYEKEVLMKHAAIFVLPSYSENFGNVVLEAMAAGCPVVITPEVGLADVVKEVGAGLVVDGDPLPLGKSLQRLIIDRPARQRMGEAGRRVVQERFSWSSVAKKMEVVYQNILQNKN